MNSNDFELAHVDTPTLENPCVALIQLILYSQDFNEEKREAFLNDFVVYLSTELQITKSAYWCYEKEVFERLVIASDAYLKDFSHLLTKECVEAINHCIHLLKLLAMDRNNLYSIPSNYADLEQKIQFYHETTKERVLEKFRNPNIKCPSCKSEFSQVGFDVARTMFTVKCPNCQQSINN